MDGHEEEVIDETPDEGDSGQDDTENAEGAEPTDHTGEDEAGEQDTDGESGEDEDIVAKGKAGTPKGVQKRIDKLTKDATTAKEKAAYLQGQLDAKEKPQEQAAAPAEEEVAPKEEDFEDYGEFVRAEARFEARQEVRAELKADKDKTAKAASEEQRNKTVGEHQDRMNSARGRYGDFDDVVLNPELAITQDMVNIMVESEHGPDVFYHLGKNPDEALRIAQLSPMAAARELGKIEASIKPPQKRQPKRISNAPDPVHTKGGGGDGGSLDLYDGNMSTEEWIAQREAQVNGG